MYLLLGDLVMLTLLCLTAQLVCLSAEKSVLYHRHWEANLSEQVTFYADASLMTAFYPGVGSNLHYFKKEAIHQYSVEGMRLISYIEDGPNQIALFNGQSEKGLFNSTDNGGGLLIYNHKDHCFIGDANQSRPIQLRGMLQEETGKLFLYGRQKTPYGAHAFLTTPHSYKKKKCRGSYNLLNYLPGTDLHDLALGTNGEMYGLGSRLSGQSAYLVHFFKNKRRQSGIDSRIYFLPTQLNYSKISTFQGDPVIWVGSTPYLFEKVDRTLVYLPYLRCPASNVSGWQASYQNDFIFLWGNLRSNKLIFSAWFPESNQTYTVARIGNYTRKKLVDLKYVRSQKKHLVAYGLLSAFEHPPTYEQGRQSLTQEATDCIPTETYGPINFTRCAPFPLEKIGAGSVFKYGDTLTGGSLTFKAKKSSAQLITKGYRSCTNRIDSDTKKRKKKASKPAYWKQPVLLSSILVVGACVALPAAIIIIWYHHKTSAALRAKKEIEMVQINKRKEQIRNMVAVHQIN